MSDDEKVAELDKEGEGGFAGADLGKPKDMSYYEWKERIREIEKRKPRRGW